MAGERGLSRFYTDKKNWVSINIEEFDSIDFIKDLIVDSFYLTQPSKK